VKYDSPIANRLEQLVATGGFTAHDLLQIIDKIAIDVGFEGVNFVDLHAHVRRSARRARL
jgi:hypothetical protein